MSAMTESGRLRVQSPGRGDIQLFAALLRPQPAGRHHAGQWAASSAAPPSKADTSSAATITKRPRSRLQLFAKASRSATRAPPAGHVACGIAGRMTSRSPSHDRRRLSANQYPGHHRDPVHPVPGRKIRNPIIATAAGVDLRRRPPSVNHALLDVHVDVSAPSAAQRCRRRFIPISVRVWQIRAFSSLRSQLSRIWLTLEHCTSCA